MHIYRQRVVERHVVMDGSPEILIMSRFVMSMMKLEVNVSSSFEIVTLVGVEHSKNYFVWALNTRQINPISSTLQAGKYCNWT